MSSTLPSPAVCRAGCARVNLTPPLGVSLAGYFHDRVARSIRDDLFVNALVLESGDQSLALVSCDLATMEGTLIDEAKRLIAADTSLTPEQVMVCATHTHTGPEIRTNAVVPRCEEWVAALPGKIAEAVVTAASRKVEGTLRVGCTELHGYSFNRLFRLRDGSEFFGQCGEAALKPAGPIDHDLQTLSFVDLEGELRALVVNFALHPDVIGGGTADFVSGDWPAAVGRNIQAVYGDEVVTVFLQGAAGDINHRPHDPTHLPTGGPQKSRQLGRAVAGAAMVACERAEPMTALPLAAEVETLAIPYYTRDESFFAELAALKTKPNLTPFERHVLKRGESWPHDGQLAEAPLQVMRLGDVALVALPAEIFVRLGLELKHFSPAPHTFVVELANARVSTYIPTTDQAERGAYGAKPILSRWLCADAGRRLVDAAIVKLCQFWP